jgi:putative DNA methylase
MRKKLIEVALPLDAINREAAREKSIRHGHPSTLHLWWARRPLAACRAVLFAQLVDDPSSHPEQFPTEEAQKQERERLFEIIKNLVKWENSNNEAVLKAARDEILKSCDGNPPAVLDPFCGGGSIPLEAQRLGLKAYASDLNPVAVLITKALIEIPPKFAGKPPVNPDSKKKLIQGGWRGAQGLADDVRYYGKWMRDEAERRIGHLYPKVKVTPEMVKDRDDLKGLVGQELTVIAWLWARTVKCPNPACGAQMPLVRSFVLSTKKGKGAWVEPVIDDSAKIVRFIVRTGKGKPPDAPKTGRGARFKCLLCSQATEDLHIKDQGVAGRMGAQLMALVAEGNGGRIYLSPSQEHARAAGKATPKWAPTEELAYEPRAIWCTLYGLKRYRDLFTPRQLVALTTCSDLVDEARERVLKDACAAGMTNSGKGIHDGGLGASAYADAVATYLAFGLSKATSRNCTGAIWETGMDRLAGALGRQALPMTWDYAETNPLAGAGGDIFGTVQSVCEVLDGLAATGIPGLANQLDATAAVNGYEMPMPVIATDPPYYDNIGYADLSDFFYVWLRHSLGKTYPQLFSTLLVPKAQELVATPYRFDGSKDRARQFFEEGLAKAFTRIREAQNPGYPITLFYAFKQAETEESDHSGGASSGALASTGWETMLEGLVGCRFQIMGTWPMRTELVIALKKAVGALASSVVLACRARPDDAPLATRRQFIDELRANLPVALKTLQHGSIAPVDLAQAAIGPGMAIFSRYSKVVETDGSPMRVRTALRLINQALDEILAEQEGEYDAETRWALAWFEQNGMNEGKFGDADTLSRAKDTAVNALQEARIVNAGAGKVRLVPRDALSAEWDPAAEPRLVVWELTQHLIRALEAGGDAAAARIIRRAGALAETAKDLAYRLYVICDRKGWSQEALAYNMLVKSWPELQRLAAGREGPTGELAPSER